MEFCPKCGSLIVEKKNKFGCMKCSYTSKGKVKLETTEELAKLKKTAVIGEKEGNTMPTVPAACPKCGNKEAYFWTSQTRSADEAETKFFKCTKCKHIWREYR